MNDPVTSIVEARFAIEDAKLISEARRNDAANKLAAAGGLAVAAVSLEAQPAVPAIASAVEL